MRHITTVAGRELRSLFVSPVAYAILSLFAVLAGAFFILGVASFNAFEMQLRQYQAMDRLATLNLNDDLLLDFFGVISSILMFLIPGITMGLFSSEKTNGTQELLMTSPLTIWDIVLGKFFAAALFVAMLIGVVAVFPGILFVYGDPELGKTLSGLFALLLVGWAYVAIGCFASALTRSQVVGFLIAFVLLILLLLLPVVSQLGLAGADGGGVGAALTWLSTGPHMQSLVQGLIDTGDLAYFVFIIGTFLLLTKAAVESVRWR